ncbi:MAG: LytTR family transcriptional regulator DNA-binding domain-containing protein [Gemmatimonadetes bacterium]|nr:LytTR family transcriptional regulator DNA-binding domain-containing protein [Gemmatimonadota bacterium]
MSLRVVVLGQVPPALPTQLSALLSALDGSLVGVATDSMAARAHLAAPVPDVAIVTAQFSDGPVHPFLRALPLAARPTAIIAVGMRDDEAVAAFELQATDFVLWPAPVERLEDALVRARQVVLQRALLRTADELQRLIGEATQVGGIDLAALFAHRSGHGGGHAGDGEGDGSGRGVRRVMQAGGTGTLVPTAAPRLRRGDLRAGGFTEDAVLDLSREDGGRSTAEGPPLRVLVREGRRTRFVPLAEVDWFEADGNYIRVHAAGEQYRTRGTISAIETALDPRQFVRIHRRVVVNMDRVREMTPLPGGDGLLLLGDGSTLRLSRTYRARVR